MNVAIVKPPIAMALDEARRRVFFGPNGRLLGVSGLHLMQGSI